MSVVRCQGRVAVGGAMKDLRTNLSVSGTAMNDLKAASIAVLVLVAPGILSCALTKPRQQREAHAMETRLTAAGFRQVIADTPTKLQQLSTMRPYVLGRTVRKDRPYWYYADPASRSLYLGDEDAYRRFQDAEAARRNARRDATLNAAGEALGTTEDYFSPENPELYGAPDNW